MSHYESEALVAEGFRKGALGGKATAFGSKDLPPTVLRPPNPDEIGQMHGYPKGLTRKYNDVVSSGLVARSLHVVVLTYLLASWHMVAVEGALPFGHDGQPREPTIMVDDIWSGLGFQDLARVVKDEVDSRPAARRNLSGSSTLIPRASVEMTFHS